MFQGSLLVILLVIMIVRKTVGVFLKISEEIGKVWRRESQARDSREPYTPVEHVRRNVRCLSPVSLSVFSLVPDLLLYYSHVL